VHEGVRSTPQSVTTTSPIRYRRAVWRLATYFRREFGYDFVQYGHEGHEDDATARAFLWFGRNVVIGACCFRWREWTDAPAGWAMQWIWLHPYSRSCGYLTRAWPYFRARFGDFHVERPLSRAMAGFLESVGTQTPSVEEA
jgi:hypothetical protein